MKVTKKYLDQLTYQVIGCAIEVHKRLGPGLLEQVYHRCLAKEFELQGINYKSELAVSIDYKGFKLGADLKCDFLIEGILPLEIKAVENINPVFEAQLMTYMNLLKKPKGLLINFTVKNIFKEGQFTRVNELYRNLPAE